MTPRSGPKKTACAAVLHGSMFSKPMRESATAHEVRVAAQAAGLRLLYHISKLALRVPLVFTEEHGIYAPMLMLRLRFAFAKRAYYSMTPSQAASTKPRLPRFCMVQCSQAHAQKRIGARSARSRASGGLEVIIP